MGDRARAWRDDDESARTEARAGQGGLLVGLALALSACTTSSSSGTQPPAGSAGSGGEGGTPSVFTCSATPLTPSKPTIALGVTFYEYLPAGPAGHLTAPLVVRACSKSDSACVKPLDTVTIDALGVGTFHVPTGDHGFDGYLDIDGMGYGPELTYFANVVGDTSPGDQGRGVISKAVLGQMAGAIGASLDPSRGHVLVRTRNCFGQTASGIAIEVDGVDGASVMFYNDDKGPSLALKVTGPSALAGVLNVPSGTVTVHARYGLGGPEIARGSAFVRGGAISIVWLDFL